MPRLALAASLLAVVGLLPLATGQEVLPPEAPAPADLAPIPAPAPEDPPAPPAPSPAATLLEAPDFDSAGRGGRGDSPFGNDPGGPMLRGIATPLSTYRVTWLPSQNVTGGAAEFGAVRQELSLSAPLWRDGADRFGFSAHVRNSLFQSDAVLPKSGLPFPGALWDVGVGMNFQHRFENDWSGGLGVQLGSASDRPFDDINSLRVGLNGFLRIPWNEHGAWNLSLSYSPFGELAIPIPGVAYVWQPSDTFRASIGIPFSIMWRATEDLTINASYMPLTNVRARASYRLLPQTSVYTEYTKSSEGYFLAESTDPRDRLLYRDSRVVGGVQTRLGGGAALELFAGYAFSRSVAEGRQTGGLGGSALFIDPGPLIGARLQIRW